MNSAFDIAAKNYDDNFTNSHIGIMQRNVVHNFLTKTLFGKLQNILEINCGTGHDAIWLAKQGHNVVATDISTQMIEIAKRKQYNDAFDQLMFEQLDIKNLGEIDFEKPFDFIFSDFGGLNCLSSNQLQTFFEAASKKLKPDGKIIAVIMPKNCVLESIYYLLKGNIKKAFRRNTAKALQVNVDGRSVTTWYYNPGNIENLSKQLFKVDQKYPVGIFIPPSYLESFFKNKLMLLKVFQKIDVFLRRFSFLSKYGDHYIITLSKI